MVWTRYGLLQKERIAFSLATPFSSDDFYMILADTSNPRTFSFTPSNVSVTNDTINIASHGLETGARVTISASSSSVLPGGIETNVVYYVIRESASLIKLVAGFDNFLLALEDIANSDPVSTAVNITAAGTGTFTLTVNPEIRTDDFMPQVATWESTANNYTRKQITIPEPSFGSPNNRINFPGINIVVEADTEDITYNYICIAADADSSIGDNSGVLLAFEDVGTIQTIPAGFGFTFILSFAAPAVPFSTSGIN